MGSEMCIRDSYEGLLNKARQEDIPVHFMGSTDTPQLSLLSSDILVNASTQPEPFGLSIIEAMACETAVVVPRAGGPKDIVEENVSGLFFEPNSVTSLAQALKTFTDAATMERLKKGALQRFKTHFLAKHMVSNLEKSYDHCLTQFSGDSHA